MTDVVVIGGGLAGLAAAAHAAGAGARVRVLERSSTLGGRATSVERSGAVLDEGPHALYLTGGAMEVLDGLGIDPPGAEPILSGALGLTSDAAHLLPMGPMTLVRSGLLGWRGRLAAGALFAGLPRRSLDGLGTQSMTSWLESEIGDRPTRELFAAFTRLSTYAADLDHLRADVGVHQLQLSLGGVRYLHGGWASMVTALADAATSAGAELSPGAKVTEVRRAGDGWQVDVDGAGTVEADRVVVGGLSPSASAALLGSPGLAEVARSAVPIEAACLSVVLRRLPNDAPHFALGVDEPDYFSVHGPPAQLGEGVVVSAMRYLHPAGSTGDATAPDVREHLESVMDRAQPGWRDELVDRRFLARMPVTHRLPTPGQTELPVAVADTPDAFVCGDWLGGVHHLADASLVSGRAAGLAAAS